MHDNIMEKYQMDRKTVKLVYDWFHKAYPEYMTNEDCTEKEMLLVADLEQYLINHE
jgi:hypothetical protein